MAGRLSNATPLAAHAALALLSVAIGWLGVLLRDELSRAASEGICH